MDRQTAADLLDNLIGMVDDSQGNDYDTAFKMGIEALKADVQPVRQTAEWIYGEKDGADGWYCSKCGFHVPWYYEYYGLNNINFIKDFHTCPHCDAKMLKYTGMEREQNG